MSPASTKMRSRTAMNWSMRLVRRCGAFAPGPDADEGPDNVEIEERRCSARVRELATCPLGPAEESETHLDVRAT